MQKIKNLGPKSLALLKRINIHDIQILQKLGWKKVMLLIAEHDPKYINANMAYALIGAIQNKHWLGLLEDEKQEAQAFIKELRSEYNKAFS